MMLAEAAGYALAAMEEMKATLLREPVRNPYWLRMQGHHGKNSTRWGRKPAKPYRRSAAVRKVAR